MVKAGLVHILRVSLDSSTKDILQAAATCLASLMSSEEQEALQDWIPTSLHPHLSPHEPLPSPADEMVDQALVEAEAKLAQAKVEVLKLRKQMQMSNYCRGCRGWANL